RLGFIDHRAERSATAGEGLCDFAGTGDEIFINLTRTGFESSVEFFSAAVERMCASFEFGQKRPAALGKRAFEVGEASVEFADHGLRCAAKQIGNTGRTFVQSLSQTVGYGAGLFIKCRDTCVQQVGKGFTGSRDARAYVSG